MEANDKAAKAQSLQYVFLNKCTQIVLNAEQHTSQTDGGKYKKYTHYKGEKINKWGLYWKKTISPLKLPVFQKRQVNVSTQLK